MKSKIIGDGNFEVFEDGTIYQIKKDGSRVKTKFQMIKHGNKEYPVTWAQCNGSQKHYYPQRLIAQAFIPNLEKKPYVEIIDGNPYNLAVSNLRWLSKEEQVRKSLASRERNRITCKKCGHRFDRTRSECPKCSKKEKRLASKEQHKVEKLKKIQSELEKISVVDLSDKFRFVIEERRTGKTLDSIGKELGVSRERVRQMIVTAKKGGGKHKASKAIFYYEKRINKLKEKIEKLKEEKQLMERKIGGDHIEELDNEGNRLC